MPTRHSRHARKRSPSAIIRARAHAPAPGSNIRTVADGLQKWLDVCEKEGRDGRDPVTKYTLKHYEWRRDHILAYAAFARAWLDEAAKDPKWIASEAARKQLSLF